MASSSTDAASGEISAAQRLLQQHNAGESSHHVTIEDVPDEDPLVPKAPLKQASKSGKIDTQSHELFPELGAGKSKANVAPIWGAKANGKPTSSTPDVISRSSTPGSGAGTPKPAMPSVNIPGRNVESILLEPQFILPRHQLRRPIPDIIKDINRKSRANITMSNSSNGRLKFDATGAQDVAQQALRDLVNQIGLKTTIKVEIPRSARAHIIGRQGATIKALQEKTGARIQLPKVDETPAANDDDDDDESTIDISVEGNAISAAAARNEILKIAGERSANVTTKLRDIPAQFYPFLAGPENSRLSGFEESGVNVRVPGHQAWGSEPVPATPEPGQRPVFVPCRHDNPIQLAGDRLAVKAARAELERRAAELREKLLIEQFAIQQGRHQFVVGPRGLSPDDFFAKTGCAIFIPSEDDNDMITVIGPQESINEGVEHAMDLAMNMQSSNIDISRLHRNAPGGSGVHARNITRFLRHRNVISELEKAHNTFINTPATAEGQALPWELYARDGKNAIKAQSAITGVIHALPPSRISVVPVDPFFHAYLRKDVSPRMTQSHGVHVVLPTAEEGNAPVLLVFEGPSATQTKPEIKPGAPSADEINAFKQGLDEARAHILDIINKQEKIASASVEVPQKFHERLRRFIKKEQEKRSAEQIPVRVSSARNIVTVRGPESAVKSFEAKIIAFVEQETQDEKERDFTLSFDFPQKFANHLIGKGGSNINELRDRFDVEIQVGDNKVDLKGPQAKCNAAKAHIISLSKSLADETTHIIKVEPKFHRELIGSGGSVINRLQTKYKVLIFFPKAPKAPKEDSEADAASDAGKPKRQQAADEVIIRGGKKGADEAREEIMSLLLYLRDTSNTATVTVPQKQVPSIIGQGGAALDDLRQATGAKIDVPGERDNETVDIVIKGTKEQVAAAKKALEAQRAVFADTVVKTLDVDKKHHRALIGSGGSALREIVLAAGGSDDRRELARTIQFPKQDADGNTIKVEGRSSVVEKIVARIQEIVEERENQVTEVLEVPIEKHRSLIGRGGETKKQLESQLSVSIDIPRQGDGKTGVKITGRAENVSKAKEHIADLVKEEEGEAIQVPRNLHHAISNNGQIFRQLRSNHHVSVGHDGQTVPPKPSASRANGGALPLITDDEETTADAHSWKVESLTSKEDGDIPWVLRGSPENVAKAKAIIAKSIEQARKNTTVGYLVLPDPKTYRYVIGQGGSTVNNIRSESGCRIQVPRNDSNDDAIELIGTEEGVEKAKELILEAVREGLASRNQRD